MAFLPLSCCNPPPPSLWSPVAPLPVLIINLFFHRPLPPHPEPGRRYQNTPQAARPLTFFGGVQLLIQGLHLFLQRRVLLLRSCSLLACLRELHTGLVEFLRRKTKSALTIYRCTDAQTDGWCINIGRGQDTFSFPASSKQTFDRDITSRPKLAAAVTADPPPTPDSDISEWSGRWHHLSPL